MFIASVCIDGSLTMAWNVVEDLPDHYGLWIVGTRVPPTRGTTPVLVVSGSFLP